MISRRVLEEKHAATKVAPTNSDEFIIQTLKQRNKAILEALKKYESEESKPESDQRSQNISSNVWRVKQIESKTEFEALCQKIEKSNAMREKVVRYLRSKECCG